MPPDNGHESASGTMGRGVRRTPAAAESVDTAAVAAFLRALADRAERDHAFGRQIAALLAESGLLGAPLPNPSPTGRGALDSPLPNPSHGRRGVADSPPRSDASAAPLRARSDASGSPLRAGEGWGERSDPFALLRERGEPHLRAHLAALDLPALRQIIRVHRLDPARISARWTNRERLSALIVDQVRARADHGKSFSRV